MLISVILILYRKVRLRHLFLFLCEILSTVTERSLLLYTYCEMFTKALDKINLFSLYIKLMVGYSNTTIGRC